MASAATAGLGTVVDEESQGHADLVGGQPDAIGGVHGLVHVGDQLGQIVGQRTVWADRDGLSGRVQHRVANNADRNNSHGRQAIGLVLRADARGWLAAVAV
ncbi:Uncharacterised protein [Mycobacteroides abscessus subsp. abscessus]|nr:Uncharacterised protein [Mycobacteroides abscessus subsp. abscessus]